MSESPDRPQIALRLPRRTRGVRAAVVVLNGAPPAELRRAAALADALAGSVLVVAVDGGLAACLRGGRAADLFVGDLDSRRRPPDGVPCVILPRDKDLSDLSAALAEVARRGVEVVTVAGLLGGRLDHEWGNLLEVGSHAASFAGILAPTGRGTVVVTGRGCDVMTVPGRTASMFALGAGAVVSLAGTRWELARRRLRPRSHGLSNVCGDRLSLTVHRGTVALVLVPPEPRRRAPARR